MAAPLSEIDADIQAEANHFPALVDALRLTLKTLENKTATPEEVDAACAKASSVLIKADAIHSAGLQRRKNPS